jgi:hypothetical protein
LKNKIANAALFAVLVIFVAACASSSVLVGKKRAPIDVSQVKVYLTPPAKFEEIALLDASSKASFSITDQGKMDTVIQRLKEEAAKLGANGILMRSTGDQVGGVVGSANSTGNFSSGFGAPIMHKSGNAIAIYVPVE